MKVRTGIGQDSHRFQAEDAPARPLVLGGVVIENERGLEGNSDADVILHALCNAISSVTGEIILGPVTDRLCRDDGITDSAVYVEHALRTLRPGMRIDHVAVSLECKRPKIVPHAGRIRARIAELLNLTAADVGLTATTGEGLTDFGRGLGIQAFVCATISED